MTSRRRPEKPLVKQAAEFVIFHLADKSAFHPFTGTDYDAWNAYIPLVRLWGRMRSDAIVAALRAVVHSAQARNEDVMAVFKKAIPCLLDWSDEPRLWLQIAPSGGDLSDITRARVIAGLKKIGIAEPADPVRVMWPCHDGPRICNHTNSRPSKRYACAFDCKDCGATWMAESTVKENT